MCERQVQLVLNCPDFVVSKCSRVSRKTVGSGMDEWEKNKPLHKNASL